MAETPRADADDAADDDSKLELPTLSIRRRRKKVPADQTDQDDVTEIPDDVAEPTHEPVGHTTHDPVAEPAPEAEQPTAVLPLASRQDDTDHQPGTLAEEEETPRKPKRKRRVRKPLSLPALDGRIAAPVTGALVGLVGVALTYIGMQGCQLVRGTTSCGGVGLFLLIAILALMVLLGAAMLKAFRISDPLSSSFLAVGLVAVLAMLLFLPYIDRWYMVIVVPVLSALTYLLSWWVTYKFIAGANEA